MRSGRLRVLALILADVLTMTVVGLGSAWAYRACGIGRYDLSLYVGLWPALLLYVSLNACLRLYQGNPFYPSMPLQPVEEFKRLISSSLAVYFLIFAFLGIGRRVELVSRFVLLFSGVVTGLLAGPVRDAARAILKRLDVGQIPAVVVGSVSPKLLDDLAQASIGLRPVPFAGDLHDVVSFAQARDVRLLVSCQDLRLLREEMPDLVRWFQQIVIIPVREAFPVYGARPIVIGGTGGFEIINQRRLKGLLVEKRLVDSLLSLVIGALALPFLLVMPILIKLTSKGPVIYKAKRLGKNGRTIYVWKFRSMYHDADRRLQSILDADPALAEEFRKDFKLKNDPRVTPLGRFMRKTSIDELPQLFNVLCGEMALVGPRPIVESEVPYYGADYEIFSLVKPGITGLWQATGRGDTDYPSRVALDRYYVLNWSPWLDLWIVLKTVLAVLKMKGSY